MHTAILSHLRKGGWAVRQFDLDGEAALEALKEARRHVVRLQSGSFNKMAWNAACALAIACDAEVPFGGGASEPG